jgi:hypothetical protein|tara:strand:- start:1643 stop:1864 length:222 start_codon:yes stop_codon:yes gene_type:complete
MPTNITINNVTGAQPFDIYVCDSPITTCIYVSTINTVDIPYSFDIPLIYSSLTEFIVKVVDNNDCIVTDTLNI